MNKNKVICGIYKITSPTGRVYIGQSKDIKKRWKSYKKLRCIAQPKIYNSLRKHGVENHAFDIIDTCKPERLLSLEKYYIELYQSENNKIGLNCDFSVESKIASYNLEYNIKRKNDIRLAKRREYNREYARKKKAISDYIKYNWQDIPELKKYYEKIHQKRSDLIHGIDRENGILLPNSPFIIIKEDKEHFCFPF